MKTETAILWRLHPEPVERLELPLPIAIGRLPICGLRLIDDDVSRLHAQIEMRDGKLVVADQGSRNGIYLRGKRVGVAELLPGAVIRLGQTILWKGPKRSDRDQLDARIVEEAALTTPLVLVGETGVGKRTIAREIHRKSGRSGPLLVADGMPDEALLRAASGGAVLCEFSHGFESASREATKHNVRLFGVTRETKSLNLPTLAIAPLRDRLNELPAALRKFLGHGSSNGHTNGAVASGIAWNADFFEALACHSFSLNFGELDVICRGLMASPPAAGEPFGIQHLPHAVRAQVVEARSTAAEDLSRERMHDALTRHRGNVRRVAQELGVQRGQLYRVLAGFGLNPDLFRGLVSPVDPPKNEDAGDERRTQT